MKYMKIVVPLIILLTLIAGFSCKSTNDDSVFKLGMVTDYRSYRQQLLAKNSPAPDFQFQLPNGEKMFLSDMKGKAVLLNFWAVTCPYCVKEMPYLQKAYDSFSSQDVVILGINTGESEKTVSNFVESKGLSFPIILDPDYYASTLYNAQYLPTTYFIDKAGNIKSIQIGAFADFEQVTTAINTLTQ